MEFKDIFREERHFCNHLFRLLCYRKEDGGKDSGLGRFLSLMGLPIDITVETVSAAEVYTEVAAFRAGVEVTGRDRCKEGGRGDFR